MKSFSFASGPPTVAECVLGAQLTLSKVAKRGQAFLRKWRFRPPPEMFDPQLKVDEEFQLRIRTSPCCRMCARGQLTLSKVAKRDQAFLRKWRFRPPPLKCSIHS